MLTWPALPRAVRAQAKQKLYGAGDAAAQKAAEAKEAATGTAQGAAEHAGGIFESVRLRKRPRTCSGPPRCS